MENKRIPVEEAAKYVGLSVSYMNRARLYGDGPVYVKLGRRVVYDVADLDLWLEGRKTRSTSHDARSWYPRLSSCTDKELADEVMRRKAARAGS